MNIEPPEHAIRAFILLAVGGIALMWLASTLANWLR